MPTKSIENHINEALTGDAQLLALDFAAHLRVRGMQFERRAGILSGEMRCIGWTAGI